MRPTRTFRVSGLLVLAGVLLCVAGAGGAPGRFWITAGCVLVVLAAPVFAVSAIRHLMRGLLWRVGSRLFVSYVLLVVPILFLAVVLYAGVWLVAAQVAAHRVEAALERREAALGKAARLLADQFASAGDPAARRALFEKEVRSLGPIGDVGCSYLPKDGPLESISGLPGPPLLPRAWIPSGPSYVLSAIGSTRFLAAIERRPPGTLLLTLRTGAPFRAAFERELGMRIDIRRALPAGHDAGRSGGEMNVTVGRERFDLVPVEPGETATSAAPPAGSGPIFGRWVYYPVSLRVQPVDWESGAPLADERIVLLLGTSVATEAERLFGEVRVGKMAIRSADVAVEVMRFLGSAAAVLFVLASVLAGLLVLRISRTTRRLSQGVAEIERGNFAHRVVLKGSDQLARLVRGFNEMASHLEASVSERVEKQALDRELQVARDLQRRLLPPSDFTYTGIEIAVDFHPAAAIGGDFYDLVAGAPPGRLTVVLADVSGHGLPTGIVMASAKASLTALLRSGANGEELLSRLDAEIARTTDSRTFVTMALLRFDLAARRLEYTNAGHVYPYRVTPTATVAALPNPARPLGLGLPVAFRIVEAPLEEGDLWVLLSDGIVEATRPGSDEEFGFPRLETALAGAAGGTAAAARDRVLAAWRGFTGGDDPFDDRTLLVLRIGDGATAT
jgi:serine phosphatase RsbU (regulator of sigma subunit)